VFIARQVAEALDHLHTHAGIIHHDVAPSNIVFRQSLLGPQPQVPDVVLIDLAVADMPGKPRRRQIYGRKTYLPPERLLDKPGSHGPAVDVFALGVVMYECLVGKLPRTGTDAINNIPLPLPPIHEQVSGISDQLAALVMAAVEHDVSQRPSLQQLIKALERTPEAQGNPRLPERKRWPWLQVGIGAALALCLVVVIVVVMALNQPEGAPLTPTAVPSTVTATLVPTETPTPTIDPTSTPLSIGRPTPMP
jgi:serine/threonine protein kinase